MAIFDKYVASTAGVDGANRPWSVSVYVDATDAKSYFAAADKATRDATKVGLLLAAIDNMMDAGATKHLIQLEELNDAIPVPSEDVLRGNKIDIFYSAGGRNFDFTIPCRKVDRYTQKENSIELELDTPAAMTGLITQIEDTLISVGGQAATVRSARLVD